MTRILSRTSLKVTCTIEDQETTNLWKGNCLTLIILLPNENRKIDVNLTIMFTNYFWKFGNKTISGSCVFLTICFTRHRTKVLTLTGHFVHTEPLNIFALFTRNLRTRSNFYFLFFLVALRSAHVPRVNGKAKRANFNRSEIRPVPCEQFHSLNSDNNDHAIERDFLWL